MLAESMRWVGLTDKRTYFTFCELCFEKWVENKRGDREELRKRFSEIFLEKGTSLVKCKVCSRHICMKHFDWFIWINDKNPSNSRWFLVCKDCKENLEFLKRRGIVEKFFKIQHDYFPNADVLETWRRIIERLCK